MINKAIIPYTLHKKVLIITRGYSECSFANNLDMVIDQLSKKQKKNLQVLAIVPELLIYNNSIEETEYE